MDVHLLAVRADWDTSYEAVTHAIHRPRNTVVAPQAMSGSGVLSGTHGSVLDPIAAIQCRITSIRSNRTIDIAFGMATPRGGPGPGEIPDPGSRTGLN